MKRYKEDNRWAHIKKQIKENKIKLPDKFNKGFIYYDNPEFGLRLIIPNNII